LNNHKDEQGKKTMTKDSKKDVLKLTWNDIKTDFKLGEGCFSNVYLVKTQLHHQKRKQMALKCLDPKKIHSSKDLSSASGDMVIEARILSQADHENIIKLHGISSSLSADPNVEGTKHEDYFLLMDVLKETLPDRFESWREDPDSFEKKGGIRAKLFNKEKKKDLSLASMNFRIETVAKGIARGMNHLHEQGILLRDLKPQNIGFHAVTGQVVLFDFGFARPIEECNHDEICGTPKYMAPEVMQSKGYSFQSDVYSFGIILYEICSLKEAIPTRAAPNPNFQKGEFSSRPCLSHVPCDLCRSLIEDCWEQDPSKRPNFEDICNALEVITLSQHNKCKAKVLSSASSVTSKTVAESVDTGLWIPV
jgi:serine/threonine protein kinase